MSMTDLAAKAETLRALHKPGDPLLLANVWDVASAKMVAELGAPAIATSSSAVALSFGERDADCMPLDVAFGVVERVARNVTLPVTADLEAGYQLEPAELVRRMVAAGAVGLNYEDSDHHSGNGGVVDVDGQAERVAAIRAAAKAAGVPIVINARVDIYVRHIGEGEAQQAEGVRRGRAYLEAGADCVYPIFIDGEQTIGDLVQRVGGNVNVNFRATGLTVAQLAKLNVARISMAGGLFRVGLNGAKAAAEAFLKG
jgi:2-methylisocitrate lyase-like PEP mutase family enzyme